MSDKPTGRNELDVAVELTYTIMAGAIFAKLETRKEAYLNTFDEALAVVRQSLQAPVPKTRRGAKKQPDAAREPDTNPL